MWIKLVLAVCKYNLNHINDKYCKRGGVYINTNYKKKKMYYMLYSNFLTI